MGQMECKQGAGWGSVSINNGINNTTGSMVLKDEA